MKFLVVTKFHPKREKRGWGIFHSEREAFWWGKIYLTPNAAWETTAATKEFLLQQLRQAAKDFVPEGTLTEIEV